MKMLTEQYLSYGRRNHDHNTPPSERRLAESRVLLFLAFCEGRGVEKLSDIVQAHYNAWIQELGVLRKSPWTIYKHQLILKVFARRRQLRIRVKPNLPRQLANREKRVRNILDAMPDLTDRQKDRILEALKEIL
jgi:hypothetical protein